MTALNDKIADASNKEKGIASMSGTSVSGTFGGLTAQVMTCIYIHKYVYIYYIILYILLYIIIYIIHTI
jgi:hypothetical protein